MLGGNLEMDLHLTWSQYSWSKGNKLMLIINTQKWSTCNFSLYYPYIIQQIGNENIQTYQVEVILIWHQILITTLQGNV